MKREHARARVQAHPRRLSKRDREINQDLFFCPPRRSIWRPGAAVRVARRRERECVRERERDEGLYSEMREGKSGKGSCGCESVLSRGETINFAGIHVDRREDEPTSTIDGLCWPTVSHPLLPPTRCNTLLCAVSSPRFLFCCPHPPARCTSQTSTNLIQ